MAGNYLFISLPPSTLPLPLLPLCQAVLDAGIVSIAVVLKHSAIFPAHEQAVGRLAAEMGFKQVCGVVRGRWRW